MAKEADKTKIENQITIPILTLIFICHLMSSTLQQKLISIFVLRNFSNIRHSSFVIHRETAEVWVSTLNDLREQGISATKQSAGAPAPQAKATTSPGKQSNTASSGTGKSKSKYEIEGSVSLYCWHLV